MVGGIDFSKSQSTTDGHQESDEKQSVSEVFAMAEALNNQSKTEAITKILNKIAYDVLDLITREQLLDRVASNTELRRETLRNQLKRIDQELELVPNDLPLEIARMVLNDRFNYGANLLRCPDGSYWEFQDRNWHPTTNAWLRNLILEEANKAKANQHLSSLVNSAKRCLDDLLGTDKDVMGFADEPLPVINCANGELWIDPDGSATLRPHRPETRLTYCLPIVHDSEATCPTYDKALLEIFSKSSGPDDMVRHWHEFLGYAIQPLRNIPSFWILIGHGSNGKTVLLNTLQRLIDAKATLNDQIDSFQRDRFNMAALQGKLVFIDDDLSEDLVLNDGLLKKLSENKVISVRHAYGRRKFNLRSCVLPVMAGNTYPMVTDVSHGLIRRAQVIPFDRIFVPEEANPDLFPYIWENELSGVLNRALEGLRRLRDRGRFELPGDCARARDEFLAHANPLRGFIEEMCARDPDGRTNLKDLRAAMKDWALDQGVKRPPADNTLKRKLEGLGYKVSKVKGYNQIFGLSLKS